MTLDVVLLFIAPLIFGVVLAYAVKGMLPRLRSLALAYLLGAAVSWLAPFGLVSAVASGTSHSNAVASLLYFSSFVSAFLGLIAFVLAFSAIATDDN